MASINGPTAARSSEAGRMASKMVKVLISRWRAGAREASGRMAKERSGLKRQKNKKKRKARSYPSN